MNIPNSVTYIGDDVFKGCSSLISKCGSCDNASVLLYFSLEIAFKKRATYLLCLKTRNEHYVGVRIPRPLDGIHSRSFIIKEDGTARAGELNTGLAFAILNDDVWSVILKFIGPNSEVTYDGDDDEDDDGDEDNDDDNVDDNEDDDVDDN